MKEPKIPKTDKEREAFARALRAEDDAKDRLDEIKALANQLFVAYVQEGRSYLDARDGACTDAMSFIGDRDQFIKDNS